MKSKLQTVEILEESKIDWQKKSLVISDIGVVVLVTESKDNNYFKTGLF